MSQQLPPDILLYAYIDDEEEENRLLEEVVQELADELYEEIDDAYSDLVISPGVALKPQQQLQRYLTNLIPSWTTDLPLLLDPDYVALFKQGLAPPIMAMPWAVLIRFPKIFTRIQTDFRHLYNEQLKEMGVAAL